MIYLREGELVIDTRGPFGKALADLVLQAAHQYASGDEATQAVIVQASEILRGNAAHEDVAIPVGEKAGLDA